MDRLVQVMLTDPERLADAALPCALRELRELFLETEARLGHDDAPSPPPPESPLAPPL
jgi:hypothetical protein